MFLSVLHTGVGKSLKAHFVGSPLQTAFALVCTPFGGSGNCLVFCNLHTRLQARIDTALGAVLLKHNPEACQHTPQLQLQAAQFPGTGTLFGTTADVSASQHKTRGISMTHMCAWCSAAT